MAKTYEKTISDIRVMIDGLKKRTELPVGITAEMKQKIETTLESAIVKNSEQEQLKAQLKAKTAELDTDMKSLNEQSFVFKKYIKLAVPKELWKEFGIDDKR